MAVRCAKCGEELLGAVNRCWKCGTTFAARPEIDGRPPVMIEMPPGETAVLGAPLEAVVLDEPAADPAAVVPTAAAPLVYAAPRYQPAHLPPPQPPMATVLVKSRPASRISTAERVEALRQSNMAMGGTVGALVLGGFALVLSLFRFEAAIIAVMGLVMGIWGLYSPRRNWALAAMLLCCLGIGLGSYTGMRQLYFHIQKSMPVQVTEEPSLTP